MILGKGDNNCTGCCACANACIKQCISVIKDDEGFFYPKIDLSQCIHCNLCSRVCHLNMQKKPKQEDRFFAAYNKDPQVRSSGSSGGMFRTFAEKVLERGGIVYGAALSDDFRRLSHASTNSVELERLLKSKYLESYLGNTFFKIKKDLDRDCEVLFCGTPCQVRGLVHYLDVLNTSRKNLLCVDFLCHGVSSESAFNCYLDYMEDRYNSKIQILDFRSKKLGWKTYCMYIGFVNGRQYIKTCINDPFYRLYFKCGSFRKSCYDCKYVEDSAADITLGDFWSQRFDRSDKGVSFVASHTVQGHAFFSSVMDLIECRPVHYSEVKTLYSSHSYRRNSTLNYDYSRFKTNGIRMLKELLLKTRIGRFFSNIKRG